MRRTVVWAVVAAVVLGVWFVTSYGPDTPDEYAAKYGGTVSQYEALMTSTDCAWLGERSVLMDARYDSTGDQTAYGYQRAAAFRMRELDC